MAPGKARGDRQHQETVSYSIEAERQDDEWERECTGPSIACEGLTEEEQYSKDARKDPSQPKDPPTAQELSHCRSSLPDTGEAGLRFT
jgi:hypothetical protein